VSTDLRSALHDAVADAPAFEVDAGALAAAGGRRVRRRARMTVAAGALAATAAVVTTAVVSSPGRDDPEPAPAEVEHVDLGDAEPLEAELLATVRTTWDGTDEESLDHDRFDAVTSDGLVLRNRFVWAEKQGVHLGLLDPGDGATDWLPRLPRAPGNVVPLSLESDRLVLVEPQVRRVAVYVLDRSTRSWQRTVVAMPHGVEVHVAPRMVLGPDDRIYVGTTMEGESGPIHWWSAPVTDGASIRTEPDLEGSAVAWADGTRVLAGPDGRVTVTSAQGTSAPSDRPPDDCATLPDAPVQLVLAGYVPVVTYPCASGPVTVLYDAARGRDTVYRGVTAVAADTAHVVLTSAPTHEAEAEGLGPSGTGTYVVNVARSTIGRLDAAAHEPQVDLAAGLIVWNVPGPGDTDDAFDVVWKVAASSWLD
jgi:hypothetical protein